MRSSQTLQGNITALFHFVEQVHIPEILRDAGPDGLSTKDIAAKVTELRAVTPGAKDVEIDPPKIGTYTVNASAEVADAYRSAN